MASNKLLPARTISIRLNPRLATDLRKAALRDANPDSATARRLLAAALARELRPKVALRQDTNDGKGDAA